MKMLQTKDGSSDFCVGVAPSSFSAIRVVRCSGQSHRHYSGLSHTHETNILLGFWDKSSNCCCGPII